MIISKKYAKKLVKEGKAIECGTLLADGAEYMVVDRYDIQRTDHYEVK